MKTNNLNSIILGLKKGYNLDVLPSKVRLFLNLPIIRIFRVIGGLSVLFFLLNKNGIISYNLPYNLNIVIMILALIQLIQIIAISIIKLIYGLNKLIRHREELEVRNSPLNRLATATVNLVYCFKLGCQVGSTGVGLLGASVLIDGALVSAGQEKIFEPVLNRGVNAIIGNKSAKDVYGELASRTNKLKLDSDKHNLLVKELETSKESIAELVKTKLLSEEEGNTIKAGLDELQNSSYEELRNKAKTLNKEFSNEYNKRFGDKDK